MELENSHGAQFLGTSWECIIFWSTRMQHHHLQDCQESVKIISRSCWSFPSYLSTTTVYFWRYFPSSVLLYYKGAKVFSVNHVRKILFTSKIRSLQSLPLAKEALSSAFGIVRAQWWRKYQSQKEGDGPWLLGCGCLFRLLFLLLWQPAENWLSVVATDAVYVIVIIDRDAIEPLDGRCQIRFSKPLFTHRLLPTTTLAQYQTLFHLVQ